MKRRDKYLSDIILTQAVPATGLPVTYGYALRVSDRYLGQAKSKVPEGCEVAEDARVELCEVTKMSKAGELRAGTTACLLGQHHIERYDES